MYQHRTQTEGNLNFGSNIAGALEGRCRGAESFPTVQALDRNNDTFWISDCPGVFKEIDDL